MVGNEIGSYTFDASAQTVTIAGMVTVNLEDIQMIINVTDQEIIYSPTDANKGGTISSNVITLEHDTTAMSDTDSLAIYETSNNSEDYSLGVTKTIDQAPVWTRYTDAEALISAAQELDATMTDL